MLYFLNIFIFGKLYFRYNSANSLVGFDVNYTDNDNNVTINGSYSYIKNLVGDVIGIVDYATKAQVVSYTYDAWGSVTSITGNQTLGALNPIRYKGYYLDSDTGMYYLQSRYYDPALRRFINADDANILKIKQNKLSDNFLFAYCQNNPIISADVTGYKSINITSKLIKTMYLNAMFLYSLAKFLKRFGWTGKLALLYTFYKLVNTNGKWDLKNQKGWKLNFRDRYVFMGMKLTAADVGNIHFGFVASVLFSRKTLCTGAGLYQIYSGTSSWKYWYSFFDDPRDTACILIGRIMWRILFRRHVFQW